MSANPETAISFRRIGRSAAILTGAAVAVQVLGILRELFVAAGVGISRDLDALLIALVLPTTLSGVLTSGTTTALVPAYLEARDTHGRDAARRLAGVVVVWTAIGSALIWAALHFLSGPAVSIAGPGLDTTARANAASYLQLVAPVALVSAVSAVLYSVAQAEEKFRTIAIANLAGAATTLATTVGLWPSMHLGALALANLTGPLVAGGLIVLSTVRASIMPRPVLWTSRAEIAGLVGHAAPLTISGAVLQVNVFADRAIASMLAPGAVSALRYAEVLVRTPISAISPAWGAALYPAMVRAARHTGSTLSNATDRSIRLVLALFVPIACLTIAVAPIAVSTAYARGAFSTADVPSTAFAVAGFAPLMVVMMTSPSLNGALNARRRGDVLLLGGVLSVIFNVPLDVLLGRQFGAAGIAMASSVASILVLSFFAWRLTRIEESLDLHQIGRSIYSTIAASLPVAIAIGIVAWGAMAVPAGFVGGLAALLVAGILGIAGYLLLAVLFRIPEALALRDAAFELAGRVLRRKGFGR